MICCLACLLEGGCGFYCFYLRTSCVLNVGFTLGCMVCVLFEFCDRLLDRFVICWLSGCYLDLLGV